MITNLATNLGDATLKEIQLLEKEIGYPILAFSYYDLEPADLEADKIAKIQEHEKDKCICLLAVKA
jgi:predicted esterase YcpF (UPF0227 family)